MIVPSFSETSNRRRQPFIQASRLPHLRSRSAPSRVTSLCHRVWLDGRCPTCWRLDALLACSEPHRARALPRHTRGFSFCSRVGGRPSSHETDPVAQTPRLLEVQRRCCGIPPGLQALDRVRHAQFDDQGMSRVLRTDAPPGTANGHGTMVSRRGPGCWRG